MRCPSCAREIEDKGAIENIEWCGECPECMLTREEGKEIENILMSD